MTVFDAGAIVLVQFPFTDLSTAKKRPALIISPAVYAQHHADVVLLALTSQDQGDSSLALKYWQAVGLPKPTWVKPVIGTLSITLIQRQIGHLDQRDRSCVRAAISMLISADSC